MATVNVNRNLTDQFYRYKMPKLIAKVEGKGNGIKTVIVNMVEVAKALNRPPTYPTKYFGCVLGAQVNFDLKNERYIVNGAHEASKLQDLLDHFIQKYVLCPSCENPETDLTVSQKKSIILTSCKACGYSGTLNSNDKLATYIIKFPPNQTNASGASVQPGKKSKRKQKGDKKDKKHQNGDANGDSDEFNNHDVNQTNGSNEEDDDDWCEDTHAEAVSKRMEQLTAGAKGLMHNDDLEKTQDERLALLFDFTEKKKNDTGGQFDITLQKEIVSEAERLDVRDKAVFALFQSLLDDPTKIIQQIKNHRLLFKRFTEDNVKAQKNLLRAFEMTIKDHRDQLLARVPHILKAFYDEDILDEEVLIDWGSKIQKKKVSKELGKEIFEKAAPFIKWLKEAEEEDDSSEEEEHKEIEVEFNDRIRPDKGIQIEEEKPKPKQPVHQQKNEADDIDIDAI